MLRTYILHFQLKAVVGMMLQHQFPSWCCSFHGLNSSFDEYDNFVTVSLAHSPSLSLWHSSFVQLIRISHIHTCIYIYRAHSSCVNLDTSIHFVNSYYVHTYTLIHISHRNHDLSRESECETKIEWHAILNYCMLWYAQCVCVCVLCVAPRVMCMFHGLWIFRGISMTVVRVSDSI